LITQLITLCVILSFILPVYAQNSPQILPNLPNFDCRNLAPIFKEIEKENQTQQNIDILVMYAESSCETFSYPLQLKTGCADDTGFDNVNFTKLSPEDRKHWVTTLENCVEDRTEVILSRSEYSNMAKQLMDATNYGTIVTIAGIITTIGFSLGFYLLGSKKKR